MIKVSNFKAKVGDWFSWMDFIFLLFFMVVAWKEKGTVEGLYYGIVALVLFTSMYVKNYVHNKFEDLHTRLSEKGIIEDHKKD